MFNSQVRYSRCNLKSFSKYPAV
uniref:Uncharacterized protein n=1 Tax=Anguilla anguilla TaxID=7936 RepID=A0A0E9RQV6_ANGAN